MDSPTPAYKPRNPRKTTLWQIRNHLGLLEEESVGSSERAPPEITYESFFDDLPAGEVDEDWLEAVMNVGAN